MKITIPVIVRTQDNGDGGYTIFVYNNEDELIADHPNPELREEILNEDDPYKNGYISRESISIEIDNDYHIRLPSDGISFSAGQ